MKNFPYFTPENQHPSYYPQEWEEKLNLFLNQEIRWENLPNLVSHVDQSLNKDYIAPSWAEIRDRAVGFATLN